jgi:hypothetical protein
MPQDDAFDRVIEQVMPLIYDHLREDALNAGHDIHARLERFVTHDQYQLARHDLVGALSRLRADALLTEYVLTHVLPAHQPQLH